MVRIRAVRPIRLLTLILCCKDLADGGAHHFAETIRKIKQKCVVFFFHKVYEMFTHTIIGLLKSLWKH